MAKTNKETLQQANEAIAKGDIEGFLAHCTENTVWNFLGDQTLRGKDSVRNWMMENYRIPPKFNIHQMIAEGEFVVAIGDITLQDVEGQENHYSYSDVWRFEDSFLAELNAYVVEK